MHKSSPKPIAQSIPSKLLSKAAPIDGNGKIQTITREIANWHFVEFEVYKLAPNQQIHLTRTDDEMCVVIVSGLTSIKTTALQFDRLGERMCPFERKKPYAIYVTPKDTIEVTAITDLEIAVCYAPAVGRFPSRLITPDDIDSQARGIGNNQRFVHNILPEDKIAESLLVVEVFTDEGATSSYPSHKHDVDNPPIETYLEETYYHRLNPNQGFCMQRVYTDDRTLDESMAVYNHDVVMVPKGYHPVATIAGYDSYYLNVMAGPVRKWCFTWEEDHAWINTNKYEDKLMSEK